MTHVLRFSHPVVLSVPLWPDMTIIPAGLLVTTASSFEIHRWAASFGEFSSSVVCQRRGYDLLFPRTVAHCRYATQRGKAVPHDQARRSGEDELLKSN